MRGLYFCNQSHTGNGYKNGVKNLHICKQLTLAVLVGLDLLIDRARTGGVVCTLGKAADVTIWGT
jgi:hypothetical protein